MAELNDGDGPSSASPRVTVSVFRPHGTSGAPLCVARKRVTNQWLGSTMITLPGVNVACTLAGSDRAADRVRFRHAFRAGLGVRDSFVRRESAVCTRLGQIRRAAHRLLIRLQISVGQSLGRARGRRATRYLRLRWIGRLRVGSVGHDCSPLRIVGKHRRALVLELHDRRRVP